MVNNEGEGRNFYNYPSRRRSQRVPAPDRTGSFRPRSLLPAPWNTLNRHFYKSREFSKICSISLNVPAYHNFGLRLSFHPRWELKKGLMDEKLGGDCRLTFKIWLIIQSFSYTWDFEEINWQIPLRFPNNFLKQPYIIFDDFADFLFWCHEKFTLEFEKK